jgi:hypothetical protein
MAAVTVATERTNRSLPRVPRQPEVPKAIALRGRPLLVRISSRTRV